MEPEETGIDTKDTYADLYDFARLVYSEYQDPNVKSAAMNLMDALLHSIIFSGHASGKGVDRAYGVSIFLPAMRSSFYNGSNYDFAAGTNWSNTIFAPENETAEIGWGQMLVNLFNITQQGGADDPNPPRIVPKGGFSIIFLPLTLR
jgi:hypothetical protein